MLAHTFNPSTPGTQPGDSRRKKKKKGGLQRKTQSWKKKRGGAWGGSVETDRETKGTQGCTIQPALMTQAYMRHCVKNK